MNVQPNWWETFFTGVAVDMWVQAVPEEYTKREADRLEELLSVAPGAEILDVPCGAGRLALVLAQRGYRMTGVDWSSECLAHARAAPGSANIAWEQRDMRDLPWAGRFDAAFCFGNSFGYLDDRANETFLRSVRQALKRGARFILETPMVLENLLSHIQPRPWWKAGDVYCSSRTSTIRRTDDSISNTRSRRTAASRCGAVRIARIPIASWSSFSSDSGFSVTVAEPRTRDAHVTCFVATAV